MSTKNSLTLEEYKSLCFFNGVYFESKIGEEYISALKELFPIKNNNDIPFTIEDVKKQPTLHSFNFSGKEDFIFICNLYATPMKIFTNGKRKNEKILTKNFASKMAEFIYNNALGVTYIITSEIDGLEHIIKFGQTRTRFKERLASYNCGVINNWRTASTTNIKMLQSMVATRLVFNLYLYDCGEPINYIWHDVKSADFASPKPLAVEDIMVKKFIEQFGTKPLVNIQADATSSKKKNSY